MSIPTADASDAGADVWDVGELEQTLDRAVLAIRPVQNWENHVEVQPGYDGFGWLGATLRVRA